MPSPKECGAKFPKGSKAYKDCIAYKNQSPVKGSLKRPAGGTYSAAGGTTDPRRKGRRKKMSGGLR